VLVNFAVSVMLGLLLKRIETGRNFCACVVAVYLNVCDVAEEATRLWLP
jgi:hypothetical protein